MGAAMFIRGQVWLVALVAMVIALDSAIAQDKRIALLIGNEAYGSEIGRLANPHNDVALLEGTLKGLGFEVVTVSNAGLGTLYQALNAYARRIQAAGPNAVGFFYYSGHGASDGSTNYLIPVDVKTIEAGELWDQSLRLPEITRKLKAEAGNATHFVVFDACRNTLRLTQPGSRAIVQSKGFVPVAQENGMLIAYATAEGELASDVGSGAGPYAKALAEEIVKPGIEAVVMFRAVQRRVRGAIRQEPYLGFNALGDVYLAGKSELPAQPKQPGDYSRFEVAQFCQSVAGNTSIAVLQSLLDAYKDTLLAGCVQARLEELKKQQVVISTETIPRPIPVKQDPSGTLTYLEGTGLQGEIIDSNSDVPKSKCRDNCAANRSCVAAEHDQEFSRCNLYSSVERTITSSRFGSFVRNDAGDEPRKRKLELAPNTGLQGDVIDSNAGIPQDKCKAACIENYLCVAAEHDEEFSRCTLFSSVTRSIRSPRYTSFAVDGYPIK
jgi:Caspase domain